MPIKLSINAVSMIEIYLYVAILETSIFLLILTAQL